MIQDFADKETEKLWNRETSRALPQQLWRKAWEKLSILDAAEVLQDANVPPGNRLESLSGNRKGQWSIRVNDQWRICFSWSNGNVHEVEIVDYHD